MAVRSIKGPSSCTSVANPQECRVSKKRGWTPSALPAMSGCAALSGDCVRSLIPTHRLYPDFHIPMMRKLTPCRARLTATWRPAGPATDYLSLWLCDTTRTTYHRRSQHQPRCLVSTIWAIHVENSCRRTALANSEWYLSQEYCARSNLTVQSSVE